MKRVLTLLAVLCLSSAAFAGTFTNEVLVLNSAATRVDTGLTGRRGIEIQNIGPNAIYCAVGASADAVLTKARRLNAGETWALDIPVPNTVYCKAATADQVTGAATIVTEIN